MSSSSGSDGEGLKKKAKPARPKIPQITALSDIKPSASITINLSMTHYEVIEDVADELGWRVQKSIAKGNWDVLWTDSILQPDTLFRMHFHQKVSHFPGIHVLARKNLLGLSLMDMAKRFPDHYNFFPTTWLLPSQFHELRLALERNPGRTVIVKPEADCQGRGIFLTQSLTDMQNGKHYVVQDYLPNPCLVDGLKFDFRVYVLLCGVSPLRLYVYEEGLARLATQRYQAPSKANLGRQYMHLTNYAINKRNPKYIFSTDQNSVIKGHKRTISSVFATLKQRGVNIEQLKARIDDIVVKTFILGSPLLTHQYRFCQPDDQARNMCFHILGLDIMLDSECRPYLLEVNHTPSFATDTQLDYRVKFGLIKDTLLLMDVSPGNKKQLYTKSVNHQQQLQSGLASSAKKSLYENQERQEEVKRAQYLRDNFEDAHIGCYRKVFPLPQTYEQQQLYEKMLAVADKTYFAENNVLRAQIDKERKEEESSNSPIRKKLAALKTPTVKVKKIDIIEEDRIQIHRADTALRGCESLSLSRDMKKSNVIQETECPFGISVAQSPTRKSQRKTFSELIDFGSLKSSPQIPTIKESPRKKYTDLIQPPPTLPRLQALRQSQKKAQKGLTFSKQSTAVVIELTQKLTEMMKPLQRRSSITTSQGAYIVPRSVPLNVSHSCSEEEDEEN